MPGLVEIELVMRLLAAGIEGAERLFRLGGLGPEKTEELNKMKAQAEALSTQLESEWGDLAPRKNPPDA